MIAVPGALALLSAWVERHPRYTYTATCTELRADGTPEVAVIRIAYDAATNVETAHVISGHMAGADVRYAGGTTADVRGPGFAHMISIRLPIRDSQILSPRGNDARVAIFSNVAQCYTSDAAHLHVAEEGGVVVITDDAPDCTTGYGSSPVTSDRLVLSADGEPLERDRYVGSTIVEKWAISDLQ